MILENCANVSYDETQNKHTVLGAGAHPYAA